MTILAVPGPTVEHNLILQSLIMWPVHLTSHDNHMILLRFFEITLRADSLS